MAIDDNEVVLVIQMTAQSMSIFFYGLTVLGHGLLVIAGALAASTDPLHESTMSAISLSKFGQ